MQISGCDQAGHRILGACPICQAKELNISLYFFQCMVTSRGQSQLEGRARRWNTLGVATNAGGVSELQTGSESLRLPWDLNMVPRKGLVPVGKSAQIPLPWQALPIPIEVQCKALGKVAERRIALLINYI
jgi:hypothetical protein